MLTDTDFCTGDISWVEDFKELEITKQEAQAYFRSLDLYTANLPYGHMLTLEDMDRLVDIADHYGGGKGTVTPITLYCSLQIHYTFISKLEAANKGDQTVRPTDVSPHTILIDPETHRPKGTLPQGLNAPESHHP